MYIACVPSLPTHFLFHSCGMFIELLEFGVLLNFVVVGCFVGCSLVVWLISSILPKCICPLFSLKPSSPHYNPYKILLIVLFTLHSSGGEFESHVKHMADCIFGMSLEWTHAIFQTHERECSTFPKSEALPVHLTLINSMSLY